MPGTCRAVSRTERLLVSAAASFGRHFAVFLAAAVVLLVLAAMTGWRWTYWLVTIWGAALLVHYLIYMTRARDER
jgi:hypothetical protein